MGRHDKTLAAIFASPVRSNINWRDIESFFSSLGATIEEAEGSRVFVRLHGRKATFHRPHPRPETDKGAVVSVRRFLLSAGVMP